MVFGLPAFQTCLHTSYSHMARSGIWKKVQAFTCTLTPQTQQFNALIRLPYLIGVHDAKFGAAEGPGFV